MSDLAQRIAGLSKEKRALLALRLKQKGGEFNALPLSFAQERLWFLDQLGPGNPAYHITAAVRLKGELDEGALQRCLDEIVRRHEILRTSFAAPDGRPAQLVSPPAALPLARHDLSALAPERRPAALRRLLSEEARRPFRLERGPLLRVTLLRLAPSEHVLLFVMHHIVSDGWSMRVLVGELGALYAAFVAGRPSPLPELPVQYADYAAWQREWLRGEVLDRQLAYWRGRLEGAGEAALELPADRRRPAAMSHGGAREELALGAGLARALRGLGAGQGATLFMTLLAGWQALLWRYTGAEEVVVGAPIAGRGRAELEGLVGFFANTLALRARVDGGESFAGLLGQVREACVGAYEHQEVPFEKVVDELQLPRRLSHTPLFQVAIALQNESGESSLKLPGLSLEPLDVETGRAKFDLELELTDTGDDVLGVMTYSTDLFDADTVKRMVGHYKNLLQAAVADPRQHLSALPILSAEERQQLLAGWGGREEDYPQDVFAHQLFEAQAERTPDAVALIFEGERLTFRELNRRSNQLARRLQSLGVGAEVPVGVCLERSFEMVVALLAILKAGGAFVPLGHDYPPERLAFMLEDAQAPVLLTTKRLSDELPAHKAAVVCLDADRGAIESESAENPVARILPDNLAYVIYTSGSTGRPKGVMVEHRQLTNFVHAAQSVYNFSAGDVMPCVVSFAFDVFLFQVLSPVLAGGTCLLVSREGVLDMPSLARLLESATFLHGPASLFHQLVNYIQEQKPRHGYERMRAVAVGGEFVAPELAQRLQRVFTAADIYVDYGPTEATMVCTNYLVARHLPHTRSIIGKPFPNMRARLYDPYLNLVPVGIPGEIFLAGACVSRGYLHRPALTAEKYTGIDGQRFYRTGDVGRYLPDGNIEFLGRVDEQVKVRGHRIELGEIEAVLAQHPSVAHAVAVAQQHRNDHKRLVAFVVAHGGQQPSASDLRQFLRQKLPDYMVPATFVALDELPLTPNGKVDRRRLAQVEPTTEAPAKARVGARTATEQALVDIWREVLGADEVGVHDNFFELGGDSILSIQIMARANQAGLRLTPRQLFEHQTIAELAEVAGQSDAAAEQGAVSGEVPLTPVQRAFFADRQPDPHHFNQSLLLKARSPLDARALAEAVRHLVAHHDALRLRFEQTAAGWRQFNAAEEPHDFFSVVDLSQLPAGERSAEIERQAAALQASLRLSEGPLLRVCYFEMGGGEAARLLLVVHHLAVDGVSWRVLLEDVAAGYAQAAGGGAVSLPAKSTSYKAWAERLREYARGEEVAAQRRYWEQVVERSRHVVRLPLDRFEAVAENSVGAAESVQTSLGREETGALLREVAEAYRTRIDEVLLTALVQAIGRWTGRRRLLVEVEGHGREEIGEGIDVSRTVGWFTTHYPLVLEVAEGAGAGEALKGVKEQVRGVPGRGMGWGLLRWLREGEGEGEGGGEALGGVEAEVGFNYLGQFDQVVGEGAAFAPARESAGPERSLRGRRRYLLEVVGSVFDGRLRMSWTYDANRLRRETTEAVAQWYMEALRDLIEHCRSPQAGGFTPSDFSKMKFSQEELDELVADLSEFAEGE